MPNYTLLQKEFTYNFYIKQKRILISDNKITNGNTTEVNFTITPKIGITNANNIYITKIIGYTE